MAVFEDVGRDLSKRGDGQLSDLGGVVFDFARSRKVLG
jgi:hypothetical protein